MHILHSYTLQQPPPITNNPSTGKQVPLIYSPLSSLAKNATTFATSSGFHVMPIVVKHAFCPFSPKENVYSDLFQ